MRDIISVARALELHPSRRNEVVSTIDELEKDKLPAYIAIRIVQGLRTIDYQNALYCQPFDGKDNDGDGKVDEKDEKVTNAKGGQSFHNYGLAFDFALLYDKNKDGKYEELSWSLVADLDRDGEADWLEVVNAFKAKGWEWGGNWSKGKTDNPHLQKTGGYTWQQLLAKYKVQDFIPGTNYVRI